MATRELELLERLFDMISTHKQTIQNEMGIISNAIYDMRLSRVKFHYSGIHIRTFSCFDLITHALKSLF